MISRASLKVLSDSSLGALTNPPPLSETRNGPHAMYAIPHGFDGLRWLPRTTQRARYAAAACSLDDSGMTSPVASLNGAAYGRDHIVPSADRNKIVEIQSASTQSKWRTLGLGKEDLNSRFELLVLPHLDSAYNLARWLLRDEQDAKDVAQEALLRAFRFFDQFRGMDARPWLLKIVRNTSFTWLQQKRAKNAVSLDDDEEDQNEIQGAAATSSLATASISADPEELMLAKVDRQVMNAAIERLPVKFKEVLLLREFEDLSYKEIAMIAEVPVGTVMSRLGRARALLTKHLQEELHTKVPA
jgi:RNA polymerase sigma-70 factor, ECF subfamily